MSSNDAVLPVVDDMDTGGFFDAARSGRLVIRRCARCAAVLHMPVAYCRHCRSWDTAWAEVAGRGTVYSWTVVEHQVHPAFPPPYTIVLVDLDELPGTRLVGRLDGAVRLEPGQPVRVRFESLDDDTVIPQWDPA